MTVRDLDVCLHLPSNRRCLVVTQAADGGPVVARCVFDDDAAFECPVSDLVPYRNTTSLEELQQRRRQTAG